MTTPLSPTRWASDITVILRTVFGAERFPVNVQTVAREISAQRFPNDAITMIRGEPLPEFEGALVRAPSGGKGWGILYNTHEFGHYLIHRLTYPSGFRCSSEDMASWESEYGQLEHQANVFAASLLMPLDDFRSQIDAKACPNLSDLADCADRYDVSLTAATLRWLQYTERRVVLVASKDGFILWARSSEAALKSGLFYKTRDRPPIEVPPASLTARRSTNEHTGQFEHDCRVWLNQPCHEHILFAEHYDFTLTLLHFNDRPARWEPAEMREENAYDHIANRKLGQSWLG